MTLEEDTFTGDTFSQMISIHIPLDYDAVKGLVLHDRTGERPEELDLKRGQYVFLTSRVCIIIIIVAVVTIIAKIILIKVTPEWYHGGTGGGRQGLIPASFLKIFPQHVSGRILFSKGSQNYKKKVSVGCHNVWQEIKNYQRTPPTLE